MTTTTADLTGRIADMGRALRRAEVERECLTKARARLAADDGEGALDVLRAYHDRYGWLLDGADR